MPGGALDLDSRFYIRRDADEDLFFALQQPRALVTAVGPRQVGKTSLAMRAYSSAERIEPSMRAVFVDFQSIDGNVFESLDAIWRAVADSIAEQLELPDDLLDSWNPGGSYNRNFKTFLRKGAFRERKDPLLLVFDEVDRVFGHAAAQDFFGSIRFFFNQGAMDSVWKSVRWILSASTEPAFFIEDISQSPFNIGLRLDLNSFDTERIADFAGRHGIRLSPELRQRIASYIGGRPFLSHMLFYHWARKPSDREKFLDADTAGSGIFKDHLHRFLVHFQREPDLAACMSKIISGQGCDDLKTVIRLESAGLVKRLENNEVAPFCDLYAEFFKKTLG